MAAPTVKNAEKNRLPPFFAHKPWAFASPCQGRQGMVSPKGKIKPPGRAPAALCVCGYL